MKKKIFIATIIAVVMTFGGISLNLNKDVVAGGFTALRGFNALQQSGLTAASTPTLTGAWNFTSATSFSPSIEVAGFASVSGALLMPMRTDTASGGFQFYNTAQMANNFGGNGNYEALKMYWTGNRMEIGTLAGGSASGRTLRLLARDASGSGPILDLSSSGTNFTVQRSTSGAITLMAANGTQTNSSSTTTIFTINPNIGQSGTAAYNMLTINPTITSHGSGNNLLINAQGNGANRFTVDVTGLTSITGSTSVGPLLTVSGTASTSFTLDSSSGTQGSCIKMKDADGSGYTYIRGNNGVLSASTVSCQ